MQNPFRYGAKVTGGSFYDRREIKASIINVIDGCNNAVLYGPRRYGKSSLVAEIIEELSGRGVVCVYVNMMDIASLGDFIVEYSKVIAAKTAPVTSMFKHLVGLFSRVRPVLGVGNDGKPGLSLSFAASKPVVAETELSGNVPYYLQELGSWVFRNVSERNGKEVREADVDAGYAQMAEAERDLFESFFRQMPESQRLVAHALATEPTGVFTADYRMRHFLPMLSTVSTAVRRLVADSQIDSVDGAYRLIDPLFANHLRRAGKVSPLTAAHNM